MIWIKNVQVLVSWPCFRPTIRRSEYRPSTHPANRTFRVKGVGALAETARAGRWPLPASFALAVRIVLAILAQEPAVRGRGKASALLYALAHELGYLYQKRLGEYAGRG